MAEVMGRRTGSSGGAGRTLTPPSRVVRWRGGSGGGGGGGGGAGGLTTLQPATLAATPATVSAASRARKGKRKQLETGGHGIGSVRVLAVLEQAMGRCRLLPHLHKTDAQLAGLEASLPPEALTALTAHQHALAQCGGAARGEDSAMAQAALKHSTRSLLRLVAKEGQGARAVLDGAPGEAEGLAELLGLLQRLYDLTLNTVASTAEQDRARARHLQALAARERGYSDEITRLEAELGQEQAELDAAMAASDATLLDLEGRLDTVLAASAAVMDSVDTDIAQRDAEELDQFATSRAQAEARVAALEAELAKIKADNKASETKLRKRKTKVEAEVENWITKYDLDMGDKQGQIDETQGRYDETLEQLGELQSRFDVLAVEYNVVMEERRIQREKREQAELDMQTMIKAAILVQRFWRSYRERKAAAKAAAKKGRKGSGKKKKKGRK